MLDDAASRLERREWSGDADAELELRLTIGGGYGDLGRYEDAAKVIASAVERASREADLEPELRTWAFARGASIALAQGRTESADAHYRSALDLLEAMSDPSPTEMAAVHAGLGHVAAARRDWDEAIRHHDASVEWARRAGGREWIKSLGNLASTLHRAGHLAEALASYDELDQVIERSNSDDPTVAALLSNRGALRSSLGDASGARADFEQALEIRCAVLGREHPEAVKSRHNLAYALAEVGQVAESETLLRECLEIERDRRPDGLEVISQLQALATVNARRGELQEAIDHYDEALARAERGSPPLGVVLELLIGLAQCQRSLGRTAAAQESVTRALSRAVPALPENDPLLANCHSVAGQIARDAGHGERAIGHFRRAVELRRRALAPNHPAIADSLAMLGVALVTEGTIEAAREAEPLLGEALERRRSRLRPDDWRIASAQAALGAAMALRLELERDPASESQRSRASEAERLLRDGYVGLERASIPEGVRAQRLALPARALARLYEQWSRLELGPGRDAEAKEWHRLADEWDSGHGPNR